MFRYIQTFYLDNAIVKNAAEASLTQIGLFFRAKPNMTNNKSGIVAPGAEVSLISCLNKIPQIQEAGTIRPPEPTEHGARFSPRFEVARREWGEIVATADASVETIFHFDNPVQLTTGREYGIVIKFDGTEDFLLWYSRQNDNLLGTTTKSPGVSSKYVGNLFTYIGSPNLDISSLTPNASSNSAASITTATNTQAPVLTPDGSYLSTNWKPISDVDLKFKVYCARYFHQGFPVASNTSIQNNPLYAGRFPTDLLPVELTDNIVQVTAPSTPQEYFILDVTHSKMDRIASGDKVYQPQPHFPAQEKTKVTASVDPTSLLVTANASYLFTNGTTFNAANGFHQMYSLTNLNDEYIVLDQGTFVDVRRVVGIFANNQLAIDRPVTQANSVVKFYKAPVGSLAGLSDTYIDGQDTNILILEDTNANTSLRFVNNIITNTSIVVGGSGYTNTDIVTISGYESTTTVKGGFAAKLALTTNSTGGITNAFITNAGCGFVYPLRLVGANVAYTNATGGSTSGSGANIQFSIGANLKCDREPNVLFANVICTDLIASRIRPEITINNPLGTAFTITHRGCFYSTTDANNFSGKATLVYTNPVVTDIIVKIFKSSDVGTDKIVATAMPSRSNQMVTPFANGAIANSTIIGKQFSNAAVFLFNISSNNDYTCPFIEPEIARSHYSKYVINNDYTNENTNYGNAYAKHVATKVNFNTDQFAEDMLVYLTAYRPAGSDLKVFARVMNSSKDDEAFDDKDWTMLEQIDGIGVYSSSVDETDYVELTYNFQNCPNNHVLNGSVLIANDDTQNIIGSGTSFTTDLANNDLIVVTNPIFSQNSFAVLVVNNVVNNTFLTVDSGTANLGVVGSGYKIAKVDYPKQAFNNVLQSNVVQYYTMDRSEVDTYDTFQLKIVFISNSDIIIPKVDDARVIGVSA